MSLISKVKEARQEIDAESAATDLAILSIVRQSVKESPTVGGAIETAKAFLNRFETGSTPDIKQFAGEFQAALVHLAEASGNDISQFRQGVVDLARALIDDLGQKTYPAALAQNAAQDLFR